MFPRGTFMKRLLSVFVLALGLAGSLLVTRPGIAKDNSRIERVLDNLQVIDFSVPKQTGESATLAERMEFYKIPGVSIAVINDFAIEWEKGVGYLKAGDAARVDEKSVFQTGSVSKFVTAVLVLHFVERGLLDLDADVNRYLTSWKIPENQFTKERQGDIALPVVPSVGHTGPSTIGGQRVGSADSERRKTGQESAGRARNRTGQPMELFEHRLRCHSADPRGGHPKTVRPARRGNHFRAARHDIQFLFLSAPGTLSGSTKRCPTVPTVLRELRSSPARLELRVVFSVPPTIWLLSSWKS